MSEPERAQGVSGPASSKAEFIVFAIIAALIWPVVAIGVVGGYGFLVWMYQLVFGPPGPPPPH